MPIHETTPPEGTRCGDPRCGQPIVHGHPTTGWVRLYVAGVDKPPVWYSSLECMIFAVGVRPGLAPSPVIWPSNARSTFTLVEAVQLLNRYGHASLTVLGLTPIRVRYVYGRALHAMDMDAPEAVAVREALRQARDVALADCEPTPQPVSHQQPAERPATEQVSRALHDVG